MKMTQDQVLTLTAYLVELQNGAFVNNFLLIAALEKIRKALDIDVALGHYFVYENIPNTARALLGSPSCKLDAAKRIIEGFIYFERQYPDPPENIAEFLQLTD